MAPLLGFLQAGSFLDPFNAILTRCIRTDLAASFLIRNGSRLSTGDYLCAIEIFLASVDLLLSLLGPREISPWSIMRCVGLEPLGAGFLDSHSIGIMYQVSLHFGVAKCALLSGLLLFRVAIRWIHADLLILVTEGLRSLPLDVLILIVALLEHMRAWAMLKISLFFHQLLLWIRQNCRRSGIFALILKPLLGTARLLHLNRRLLLLILPLIPIITVVCIIVLELLRWFLYLNFLLTLLLGSLLRILDGIFPGVVRQIAIIQPWLAHLAIRLPICLLRGAIGVILIFIDSVHLLARTRVEIVLGLVVPFDIVLHHLFDAVR